MYSKIMDLDNIKLAIKQLRYKVHTNPYKIQNILKNPYSYIPKPYKIIETDRLYCIPKTYPDKIIHNAVLNVLSPTLMPYLIPNTYQCIKDRGVHKAVKDLHSTITTDSMYFAKVDIKKFYNNIDRDILKTKLFKVLDTTTYILVSTIIDLAPYTGLPIGNSLSHILANYYLNDLDHKVSKLLPYFRYADDIVLVSESKTKIKEALKLLLSEIKLLKLQYHTPTFSAVKHNGINFLGFNINYGSIKLRQSNQRKVNKLKRLRKKGYLTIKDYKKINSVLGYSKPFIDYSLFLHQLSKVS